MEEIALRFLSNSKIYNTNHIKSSDSVITVKDTEMFSSHNDDSIKDKKFSLCHLQRKLLDEIEVNCDDSDETSEISNKTKKHKTKLIFNFCDVINSIENLYIRINQKLNAISCNDEDEILFANINHFLTNQNQQSVFANIMDLDNEDNNNIKQIIFENKIKEIISIGLFIYYLQINANLFFGFTHEEFEKQHLCDYIKTIFASLYENIILFLIYNENPKSQTYHHDNNNIAELKCYAYVSEYYKSQFKPVNDNIANKLKDNLKTIDDSIAKFAEIVVNNLYHIVETSNENFFAMNFVDELSYFERILLLLKDSASSTYTEIKNETFKMFSIYKTLIKQNTSIAFPYLPSINTKYKYTLVVDLDETLVHYVEDDEKAYVQVRPFAEHFLKELAKLFEIVIFTAADEEYADIVLKELDKSGAISHRLYRKHTTQANGVFFKDLSKLGRDIKKVAIIDNSKENFVLQPENGLHIKSFIGDQNDNELFLLTNDLGRIAKEDKDDIRPILEEIRQKMEKRYKEENKKL